MLRHRIHHYHLFLLLLVCAVAHEAGAAPLTWSTTIGDKPREATVDAFQADNQAYISLDKLIKQMGGSTRQSPGKLTMDLGGRSAVVTLNGTQVSTSSATFSLQAPVKEADGGPYIAVGDLERLFDQAFAAAITRGPAPKPTQESKPADETKPAESNEKTEAAGSGLDNEANMGLLESVAPAATPSEEKPAETAPGETAPATPPLPTAAGSGEFLVVLDPGHGGNDSGLVAGSGATEKEITLAIARAAEKKLAESGKLKVLLARSDDKDVSIPERSNIANQAKASLYIALHLGGSTSPAAHGFDVFVQATTGPHAPSAAIAGESRYQADAAAKLITEQTGASLRGVHEAPLRALANLTMPALLVELGMLTTPAEESLLVSGDYQQKVAGAIAALAIQAAAHAGEKK